MHTLFLHLCLLQLHTVKKFRRRRSRRQQTKQAKQTNKQTDLLTAHTAQLSLAQLLCLPHCACLTVLILTLFMCCVARVAAQRVARSASASHESRCSTETQLPFIYTMTLPSPLPPSSSSLLSLPLPSPTPSSSLSLSSQQLPKSFSFSLGFRPHAPLPPLHTKRQKLYKCETPPSQQQQLNMFYVVHCTLASHAISAAIKCSRHAKLQLGNSFYSYFIVACHKM